MRNRVLVLSSLSLAFVVGLAGCDSSSASKTDDGQSNPQYQKAIEQTQKQVGSPFSKAQDGSMGGYPTPAGGAPGGKMRAPATSDPSYYGRGTQPTQQPAEGGEQKKEQ